MLSEMRRSISWLWKLLRCDLVNAINTVIAPRGNKNSGNFSKNPLLSLAIWLLWVGGGTPSSKFLNWGGASLPPRFFFVWSCLLRGAHNKFVQGRSGLGWVTVAFYIVEYYNVYFLLCFIIRHIRWRCRTRYRKLTSLCPTMARSHPKTTKPCWTRLGRRPSRWRETQWLSESGPVPSRIIHSSQVSCNGRNKSVGGIIFFFGRGTRPSAISLIFWSKVRFIGL